MAQDLTLLNDPHPFFEDLRQNLETARKAYVVFIISAISIVALGIWLASIGDRLSTTTGLSVSFVGNLFLATSTSLPEIAASLAAIRLGAIDLAIGNAEVGGTGDIGTFPQ